MNLAVQLREVALHLDETRRLADRQLSRQPEGGFQLGQGNNIIRLTNFALTERFQFRTGLLPNPHPLVNLLLLGDRLSLLLSFY